MNPLLKIPIRLQLLVVVAIVALPAAGMIFHAHLQDRRRESQHALKDTRQLVGVVTSEQKLLISSAEQMLLTLGQLREIDAKDAARTDMFLKRILRIHPNIINIFVTDLSGKVWASALPLQAGITASDRRYFRNAMATGKMASGEYQLDRISGVPSLNFGYPYRNAAGKITGVIAVAIALDRYANVISQAPIPKGSNLVFTDHKGVVLFSALPAEEKAGTPFDPRYFSRMQRGPDAATAVVSGLAGKQKCYVSYRKLRLDSESTPYAYVWVSIPAKAAFAGADNAMARETVAFALVLGVALLLAWFVGNRSIAQRISVLEQASRRLAGGDLDVNIGDVVRGGEIGRLGESFDDMARQLHSREQTLSTSQRFLTAIIDSEPECLLMLDLHGRVLMINPAGVRTLQAESGDEITGTPFDRFVSAPFKDAFAQVRKEISQGRPGNLEVEVVGLKGAPIWLEVHAVPFRDDEGEIVSALAIARDMTERHLAELALTEREAELRKAQEIANVGSWTSDMSGRVSWSLQMYRIFGVTPETFTGEVPSFLNLIHPDDRGAMEEWIRGCAAGEKPGELEFRAVRPDGTIRYISGRGELITGPDGTPVKMSGTGQDVTDRKLVEAALDENRKRLEELNRNLEARVADAIADLRKKDQMLIQQSRLAAMGEMIGNIAHQWRQPLNALGLLIQELPFTYRTESFTEETLRASVKKGMELITHMSRTIDDFSSFFKPDAQKSDFSVEAAVGRTLSLIEAGMKSREIRLEVSVREDSVINGYPGQFAQVLLNLLINARDAFEERGIDGERIIAINAYRENGKAVVTVADNAGGIPEAIMEKIFDPYFTTKGPGKGSGIGLYMAKAIIENNMKGKLSVRNTAAGAEFRIEV